MARSIRDDPQTTILFSSTSKNFLHASTACVPGAIIGDEDRNY